MPIKNIQSIFYVYYILNKYYGVSNAGFTNSNWISDSIYMLSFVLASSMPWNGNSSKEDSILFANQSMLLNGPTPQRFKLPTYDLRWSISLYEYNSKYPMYSLISNTSWKKSKLNFHLIYFWGVIISLKRD